MTNETPIYSAAQSAAGYFYQARLALAECLRFAYDNSHIEIAIEKLDDVSFEKDGNALELLQTKHHVKKSGDLTNTSVDLWKTLRVWADATKADPSLPGRTRFALITTAQAPEDSAAAILRPRMGSVAPDLEKAEAILLEVANSSKNIALGKAFSAFIDLTPAMRRALIASIEILDHAPLIGEVDTLIENRLRMIAPRGKAAIAREQLEGWWWPRICATLQASETRTISIIEVEQKLDDIRDSIKRDMLPLDMENVEPPESELIAFQEMKFVHQLRTVGIDSNRLQFAMRDYYRAFTQRSRWTRLNLLFDGEVSRFEQMLIEEWQPRFAQMCEDLLPGCMNAALLQGGQRLYHWVETEARFPFRTQTSRFLNVGSYHMLANDLRIGWHRDYKTLLTEDESDGANEH